MKTLRHLALKYRTMSALLIALILMMKMLVPTGYMVGSAAGSIQIVMCTGAGPMKMEMPVIGRTDMGHKQGQQGKEISCAFSGISTPAMSAADPLMLAIAVALIMAAVANLKAHARVQPRMRLRPPLRGPPSSI